MEKEPDPRQCFQSFLFCFQSCYPDLKASFSVFKAAILTSKPRPAAVFFMAYMPFRHALSAFFCLFVEALSSLGKRFFAAFLRLLICDPSDGFEVDQSSLEDADLSEPERAADDDASTESLSEPVSMDSRIFLSHSGKQKAFVEHLNEALKRCRHETFFDQDHDSLPKGRPFPKLVIQAARSCTLAVVVVSDDYFMSKWPMLELQEFFREDPDNDDGYPGKKMVLPLFYKLLPEDCKARIDTGTWEAKWKSFAEKDKRVHPAKWMKAVKKLLTYNGLSFVGNSSELVYLRNIVEKVCCLLPPHLPYDQSDVQGLIPLRKKVQEMFGVAWSSCNTLACAGACAIGLYGVGGVGKTTMSRCMVNFYSSQYGGKACFLELPTAEDKVTMLNEFKHCLRILTQADDSILKYVATIEQVISVFERRLQRCTDGFFLGIDNVWEHSYNSVEKLINVVSGNSLSKILVTSRREDLLKALLPDPRFLWHVPSVSKEDSCKILEHYSGGLNLSQSLQTAEEITQMCLFDGHYHPLLLKALGNQLKMGKFGLHELLGHYRWGKAEETVNQIIRTSYDILAHDRLRHTFLDVALLGTYLTPKDTRNLVHLCNGLTAMYAVDPEVMEDRLSDLESAGLLQFKDEGSARYVYVHDLYVGFAERIAAECPRWLYFPGGHVTYTRESLDNVNYSLLERVVLYSCPMPSLVQQVTHNQVWPSRHKIKMESRALARSKRALKCLSEGCCSKLKFLMVDHNERINTDELKVVVTVTSMHSLRILILKGVLHLKGLKDACDSLVQFRATQPIHDFTDWEVFSNCQDLQVFEINGSSSCADLDLMSFTKLFELGLRNCNSVRGIFNSACLTHVLIENCGMLDYHTIDISAFMQLTDLELEGCHNLKQLVCLASLTSLRSVKVSRCSCLVLIDLAVPKKQICFQVGSCESLVELRGSLILGMLSVIKNCSALRNINFNSASMPDFHPTALNTGTLEVDRCSSLEDMVGLSLICENISIKECKSLKLIRGLHSTVRSLHVRNCKSLVHIKGIHFTLRNLDVHGCEHLVDISICWTQCPSLLEARLASGRAVEPCKLEAYNACLPDSCLFHACDVHLDAIRIVGCLSLSRIPDWSRAKTLSSIYIATHSIWEIDEASKSSSTNNFLWSLKCIPDWSSLTNLSRIHIGGLISISHIPDWSALARLSSIELMELHALQCIPAWNSHSNLNCSTPCISNLANLRRLSVTGCTSLLSIPDWSSLTNLESIDVGGCTSLRSIPDWSALTNLESIRMVGCTSLLSIPDWSALTNLKSINMQNCSKLSSISDWRALTNLDLISMDGCSSLVSIPDWGTLTKLESVFMDGCTSLLSIPNWSSLTNLYSINLKNCSKLSSIPDWINLLNVLFIHLGGCASLQSIPDWSMLTKVRHIDLSACVSLTSIPDWRTLTKLTRVDVSGCTSLSIIPDWSMLPRLSHINVGL